MSMVTGISNLTVLSARSTKVRVTVPSSVWFMSYLSMETVTSTVAMWPLSDEPAGMRRSEPVTAETSTLPELDDPDAVSIR